MIRILCTLTVAFMAGAMVAGCADDPYPDRQRPAYSYENVDMGPPQSGQHTVSTNVRQLQTVILIAVASLGAISGTLKGKLVVPISKRVSLLESGLH